MSLNPSTLHRALGIDEMYAALSRGGWTGADLKEYVGTLKAERFDALDSLAGGELTRQSGTPLYAVFVEMTALRFVLAEEEKKDGRRHLSLVKCPHGFVGACRACERGPA